MASRRIDIVHATLFGPLVPERATLTGPQELRYGSVLLPLSLGSRRQVVCLFLLLQRLGHMLSHDTYSASWESKEGAVRSEETMLSGTA
jgi:hypothetical protein